MKLRFWLSAAFGITSIVVCPCARAAGISVLFEADQETPFSNRVRAEISAMGFELITKHELDLAGSTEAGAEAAARVIETPPPRRVELWLRNETTGRLELGTVITAPAARAEQPDDAPESVRASEHLRAFFQPLRTREAEPTPSPPAPTEPAQTNPAVPITGPSTNEAARPEPRSTPNVAPPRTASTPSQTRYIEEIALALPLDRGTLGFDAMARAGAWLSSRVGVGAKLVIPIFDSEATLGENSASISTTWLGAELWYRLWSDSHASLSGHAGLALAWLRAAGNDTAPSNTAKSARAFAALPSLGLRATRHVIGDWSLSAGGEVGFAIPKFNVVFAGQRVGTWSAPVGLVSVGASLEF